LLSGLQSLADKASALTLGSGRFDRHERLKQFLGFCC
jgi:hypothetical protein